MLRSSSSARRGALAAVCTAIAVAGCGGDDAGRASLGNPRTATEPPPGTTAPAPPPATSTWRPPAIPFDRGAGPEIGALIRLSYATSAFPSLPRGFVPGGIPVGSRAGSCHVPAVTERDRRELHAAAERQTPRGAVAPITDVRVLLADCGAEGRWAMVGWRQTVGGATTDWVDELRRAPDSDWDGTARGVHPGCRMPRDAAAVWQLDVTPCGPAPRPRAAPRARPAPRPGSPAPDESSSWA